MNELDYSLLDAIKCMGGESEETKTEREDISSIGPDSTDIEILDYIIVFVCSRIKSVTSYAAKGGYVLMKIIPDLARYSHDIDLSISSGEQYELVKEVLHELGDILKSKDVISGYEIKETISPTSSGGIKLMREGNKKDLGIDIGWHDLSYGIKSWNILNEDFERFTVERMLADKLSAIYSRKRFRRTKDLYDVHIITSSCTVDADKVREYLERRGIDWDASPFKDVVIKEYARGYDKLDITSCNGKLIDKPDFSVCMKSLARLVAAIRGE